VYWDDIAGAREAVRYLIELGHTDICYVGGPALPWITRPYLGYRQAMLEAGLEPHPELAALAGDAVENGRMIVELLLEKHRRFTAILADHETLTGACEALRGKRLETPRDVSVISLTAKGLASGPAACTALEVDAVQVGRALARMALERARVTRPVDNLSIPMDLVKRGSCRPISL
jgi:DNA-binding LacI/PurR family transcriptional regulator